MRAVFNYFKQSWRELGKLTWPNREQTIRLTAAVIIFSLILAFFISTVDYGLAAVLKKLILKQ